MRMNLAQMRLGVLEAGEEEVGTIPLIQMSSAPKELVPILSTATEVGEGGSKLEGPVRNC